MGQINLNQLIQFVCELEDLVENQDIFSDMIRRKVNRVKMMIIDIKPQSTEYGIDWIEAK